MKFTPLKFQGSLAAAGISLMPFNYLKSTFYKGESAFNFSQLSSLSLSSYEQTLSMILIFIMFAFIAIHFIMTIIFLKELIVWLINTNELKTLIKNPLANTSLFSPLISLPMSLIVFMGPLSFFLPQISKNLQSFMLPALAVFIPLWVILITLEILVLKNLFTKSFDFTKLNFGWLLDVLSFGAVSLLGSSIATASSNGQIASIATVMTIIALCVGIILSFSKIAILFYQQLTSKSFPAVPLIPAYFLVIPPLCLLWFSFYKILIYLNTAFGFETAIISFFVIVLSYIAAITWFGFLIILLFNYFKSEFMKSDFSPAQWGIV